jgi:conjugal transfer mating pair stabilization protein TraN
MMRSEMKRWNSILAILVMPVVLVMPVIIIYGFIVGIFTSQALGATRFSSSYPCSDIEKVCTSTGTKTVDGFQVTKDCWEWSYKKICNYPSKDDCKNFSHCYAVAELSCLLKDNYGNCVNLQREFSCKRWIPAEVESQKVRMGFTEKDGDAGLVCSGIPCIDGNCVDKSYMTNGEMMDAKDLNFKIFAGYSSHCSKKATEYTNCCTVSLKGWGSNLGARCSNDERQLMENRKKKLCVYVGKENKGALNTVVKHHYCCFGNLLQKVIQVEGRKQLYAKGLMSSTDKDFGSGGSTNCRGLTLAELQNMDFDKMDLTEFIEDFKLKFIGRYKVPNVGDITTRVQSTATSNLRQGDDNQNNKENNRSGWSNKVVVDE